MQCRNAIVEVDFERPSTLKGSLLKRADADHQCPERVTIGGAVND
jgi:hypothetical protein